MPLRLPAFPEQVRFVAVWTIILSTSLTAWTVVDAKRSPATGRLAAVDGVIEQAIHDGNIPGAVLLVGHNRQVIYRKAYGNRALEPRREPMTLETIFDLASLTKVIATTTAVMKLVEQGKIRLNDPVAKYLPEFGQNGKEDITVRQLLTHYSGLAPDLGAGEDAGAAAGAFARQGGEVVAGVAEGAEPGAVGVGTSGAVSGVNGPRYQA